MKTTKDNYKALCETMYNFTGLEHWLNKPANDRAMKENFITCFHEVRKQVQQMVESGMTFRYPLINLSTGQPKPFIYNSMEAPKGS